MSSPEQNDRHIIWSDISLDLDDWRESLEELYPGYSDDELYNLLTKGILNSHLAEVQQRASELEETLVKQMAQKAGLTEQMKAEDMMKWVRLMNNIRNSAQEIVKNQVIFA